ncbi:PucR family transcriptional regulator [Metabacillus mangrovi]|nr:helix-turn-helix domain-containing protein [Metabacillus mangrovi]
MLQQLINHYQRDLLTGTPRRLDEYSWFLTESGESFGISKSRLSDSEEALLQNLFAVQEMSPVLLGLNDTEKSWHSYLLGEDPEPPGTEPVRFIHGRFSGKLEDAASFMEAAGGFMEEAVVIWLSEDAFVLIEQNAAGLPDIEAMTALTSTLLSDFFIEPAFFAGQIHESTAALRKKFHAEQQLFRAYPLKPPKTGILTFYEACPVLLAAEHSFHEVKTAVSERLSETLEDKELIETLRVFFLCNLNVSSAAKALFMHRNSLQYRIDRFIERTGIDIKFFTNALAVYLLILQKELEK